MLMALLMRVRHRPAARRLAPPRRQAPPTQ
jgi:hypothetical protein